MGKIFSLTLGCNNVKILVVIKKLSFFAIKGWNKVWKN